MFLNNVWNLIFSFILANMNLQILFFLQIKPTDDGNLAESKPLCQHDLVSLVNDSTNKLYKLANVLTNIFFAVHIFN